MSRIPHTCYENWAATLVPYIHYPKHMHTTISVLLEYRVGGAIENNVARESLEQGLSQQGYGNALRYLLNRIKIRNKFSRSRYVKLTGGVSVDRGGALDWRVVKRKVVRY